MTEDRKITWVENVDGYKLQVVVIEDKYTVPVWFGQALQRTPEGGWVEAWGTAFLETEEEAKAAVAKAWGLDIK